MGGDECLLGGRRDHPRTLDKEKIRKKSNYELILYNLTIGQNFSKPSEISGAPVALPLIISLPLIVPRSSTVRTGYIPVRDLY